jgi:Conserved oligomeric complex COG6
MRQFYLLMAEKTQTAAVVIDEDLGPPAVFLDAIADLRIILGAYESSLTPVAQAGSEISTVLKSALHPYLHRCELISTSLPRLAQCTVMFNCYDITKVSSRFLVANP